MKYIALISLIVFSQFANAKANIPASEIKSVNIAIYNKNPSDDITKADFVLDVYLNGKESENLVGSYQVSPGALTDNPEPGKEPELTPEGVFNATRLEKDYVSKQFGGKVLGIFETGAMPYTIFFHNGFAIHGSKATVDGKPASKGCVRLKKKNAKKVFNWVKAAIANTKTRKSVTIEIFSTESPGMVTYRRDKYPTLEKEERPEI